MANRKIEEIVEEICTPITDRFGLNLVDIEYKKEGKNFILRVIIDKPEGVVIEDCENVSRELSVKLDEIDPIESGYYLEVQSPGERNLKKDREFEYFRGRDVEVRLYEAVEGKKSYGGKLVGMEDNHIKIMVEGERMVGFPKEIVASVKLKINL